MPPVPHGAGQRTRGYIQGVQRNTGEARGCTQVNDWALWPFPSDDRPVRDSERKASKLHFASEDSVDSRESFSAAVRAPRSEAPSDGLWAGHLCIANPGEQGALLPLPQA